MMKSALAASLVTILLAPPALSAHENFRIVGAITKLTAEELDVRNLEGRSFTVDINERTVVKKDKDKAKYKIDQLKVGQSVIVGAWGDDEFSLEALEIRIVPPLGGGSTPKKKGGR
jgi:hypothetical protein